MRKGGVFCNEVDVPEGCRCFLLSARRLLRRATEERERQGPGAKSWKEEEMRKLFQMPGVIKVKGDMCEFEMIQEDGQGVGKFGRSRALPRTPRH